MGKMIRQPAFTGGEMLKGGLHCHTTRSDGKGDPAEVIRLHKEHGYDFMTLTDHRKYNYDSFGEEGIVIIPGMEMDANFPERAVHCHHIVCIGPEKQNGNGYDQDQYFDSRSIRKPEDTQPMLDWIHENGNMTIYCHPEWSGTPAREFEMLRGNFAMEIWNSGCAINDRLDTNAAYWDELLIQGQQIYGVAVDDGHAMNEHCNGWVMVRAERSVSSILNALKEGCFYSSCGPEIRDFYVEDGWAYIASSPVKEIKFHHLRAPYSVFLPAEGEETLSEAKVRITAPGYIRASVLDAEGHRAWTNPIFFEGEND